jgi:CHAD domain-containing protein
MGVVGTEGVPNIFPMPKNGHPTSDDLVRAMLASQRSEIVENELGARLGKDPEFLHRMRVATRRARAMLRAARGVVEPEREEKLRDELAWLGGVLGDVRDLDVLIARLKEESQALEPAERAALKPLFARLTAERRKARSALTRALKSPRYTALLAGLAAQAVGQGTTNGEVKLDKRAEKEFGRLVKAMDELGSDPTDDELHEVRKKGKRARYAAELASPLAPKAAAKFVKRAKAFQDVAGEHQDAVVAEDKLRALSANAAAPEAFAAGRLAERERERRETARARLPRAWKDLERAGNDAWS